MWNADAPMELGFCNICMSIEEIPVGQSACLLCQLVEDNVAPTNTDIDEQSGASILRTMHGGKYSAPAEDSATLPLPEVPLVSAEPILDEEPVVNTGASATFCVDPGTQTRPRTKAKLPHNFGIPPELHGKIARIIRRPVPNPPAAGAVLMKIASEYMNDGNVVGEFASLMRAAGYGEGSNKDGPVYKYCRYISILLDTDLSSRAKLLAEDSFDTASAELWKEACSVCTLKSPAKKIHANYMRAFTLYRHLCASLY